MNEVSWSNPHRFVITLAAHRFCPAYEERRSWDHLGVHPLSPSIAVCKYDAMPESCKCNLLGALITLCHTCCCKMKGVRRTNWKKQNKTSGHGGIGGPGRLLQHWFPCWIPSAPSRSIHWCVNAILDRKLCFHVRNTAQCSRCTMQPDRIHSECWNIGESDAPLHSSQIRVPAAVGCQLISGQTLAGYWSSSSVMLEPWAWWCVCCSVFHRYLLACICIQCVACMRMCAVLYHWARQSSRLMILWNAPTFVGDVHRESPRLALIALHRVFDVSWWQYWQLRFAPGAYWDGEYMGAYNGAGFFWVKGPRNGAPVAHVIIRNIPIQERSLYIGQVQVQCS